GWLLKQIGVEPVVDDPCSDVLDEIEAAMTALQNQIRNLFDELKSDEELKTERRAPESEKPHSIAHIVKHISQHYLYHTSQIIYLRRAQDRNWEAPTKIWESAVNTISDFTWKGRIG
ncbi:hypothetical protein GWO43_13595, partial [candidate division KSB1 bacterium]|nr:hypothetical protein [candidate division KSB1 bacterium]NIR71964.1 hypothetical protein [candidate division KSB1 bacterium]NIS24962.1 hypothetical protein [candidate division KSB1 bacterium]NIT71882.1 hypothetical protein [candidate division KSB1 bacterium]NIU25613.1 hypothetical protein [candidate division KSB1 bacterium]